MWRGQHDAAQAERGRPLQEMAQAIFAMAEIEQQQVEPERLELALHVLGQRRVDALLDIAGHQRNGPSAPDAQAARHFVGAIAQSLDRLEDPRARFGGHRHAAGDHPRHGGGRDTGMCGDRDDAHHDRAADPLRAGAARSSFSRKSRSTAWLALCPETPEM